MKLPSTTYPAPFDVTRASHVVLSVKDLAASKVFYADVFGLVLTREESGALYFRGLEEAGHHSLVLRQASAAVAHRVGLRVYTNDDLYRAKDYFEARGLKAAWADVPHQGRTLHAEDALGTPLEFCATMDVEPRQVVQFQRYRGGAAQRIDHFQIVAPDLMKAIEFYLGMGFRLSEYAIVPATEDLIFAFMQRKGNPYDIVFGAGPGPRLHHAAFSVPDVSSLLHACDTAGALGFGENIEWGPTRHGPGHAIFCYFRDPDGHRMELFTTHYQMLDVETQPVRWEYPYPRPWGYPPRRKWFMEAMHFEGVALRHPPKPGDPYTLEKFLAETE